MDLWQAIKADHDKVDALFEAIEDATEEDRVQIIAELTRELEAHAQGEERAVYPELAKLDEFEDAVSHAREEHDAIRGLLQQIEAAEGDEQMVLLGELEEIVQDHVEEEEEEVIPIAQDLVPSEQAEAMLQAFEAAKAAVSQS